MITSTSAFQEQTSNINSHLFSENNNRTTYIKRKKREYDLLKEELVEWYNSNFKCFPLFSNVSTDEVVVSSYFMENYGLYHKNKGYCLDVEIGTKELSEDLNELVLMDLVEIIDEWLWNIYYEFSFLLEAVKKEPVFAGINDNIIVMKNLLQFYTSVKESNEIQLHIFSKISLPKKVVDEMTSVLIILLKDKLNMFDVQNIETNTIPIIYNNESPKIKWLGSQKEFVELILELETKNYISFDDITTPKKASLLSKNFDFSSSQKKGDSNIVNNLTTHLKSKLDRASNKQLFFYDDEKYKRKFASILPIK